MTEDRLYGTEGENRGIADGVLLLSPGTIKIAYSLGKLEIESAIVPVQITRWSGIHGSPGSYERASVGFFYYFSLIEKKVSISYRTYENAIQSDYEL